VNLARRPKFLLPMVGIAALLIGIYFLKINGNCALGLCRARGDAYNSKMSALEKTESSLIKYREDAKIATGLEEPRGIAVDNSGTIYVAGDYAIRVFGPDGAHKRDIRTSDKPNCLVVSGDGTIYAGMQDHVEVFAANGSRIAKWNRPPKDAWFTSIAIAGKNVWVADARERVALRYSLDGNITGTVGARDRSKNAPGLIVPSPYVDVAPAADGAVWISDPGRHQLELYASDGRLKRSWGKDSFGIDGFSGCCNPTDFAILPDGRFVTSEKGIPRVKIYGADGRFQSVVAPRETFTPDTAGLDIAVDKKGRILILDPAVRSVRVFVRKGL
jgi:sugar lactone lactonase YvrE